MTNNSSVIDSREAIKKVDPQNVLGSVEALANQLEHAWQDTQKLNINFSRKPQNIVVAAMGGSGLGPDVIKHLFKEEIQVPLEIVNDYTLPGYVDHNSLVVLASYSGTTEEVINCIQQAQDKKAQLLIVAAGGKLAEFAKENQVPAYIINAKHNPSNQPRMAIGYAIVGMIGLLNKAGFIKVTEDEIKAAIQAVTAKTQECSVEIPADENPAKTLAFTLVDKRPYLVASEFLLGAVHAASNQINENSKVFSLHLQVPEINHHLLESLEYPQSNQNDCIFLFFNSQFYLERNQLRMKLTQEAVEKQGCETLAINLSSSSKITQVFELITLMAFTNTYLAILYNVDPSQIQLVDWFKQELAKA